MSAAAKGTCAVLSVLILFSYGAQAQAGPSITGFLVNGVPGNSGPSGTILTIQGSGFGNTQGFSTATLNGTAVAGNGVRPNSWSDTSIVVVIPRGATSGPVVVRVGGNPSNGLHFTVAPAINADVFHTARLITTGVAPGAIAAGDLNGDGKADLVYPGTVVHILISNGDGTFMPETTLDPGMATRAVAIADVNGDGHPDIIVVGNGGTTTATANVFLGNGDGTFQVPALTSAVAQSTSNFPAITALALGDFDGDGKLDLLASDGLNNAVSFSKGDGLGHFSLQRSLLENGGPGKILVADLNHDGHLDFAVHSVLGADEQVFMGNGDGTFAPAVSYRGPNNVTGAALVDVDGDGNLDLVISDFNNNVDVLLGKGDGTFSNTPAAPGVFWGAASGGVFAAGDFNHDGRPDIAVISRNGITILLGAPGLTFTVGGTYAATSLPDTPPAVGDFNGDGQPDFAVSGPFDKQIAVLLGKPDGTLNAASAYEVGAAVNSVAVADVNADGIPDLVVGTARSTPSVLLGLGAGTYQPPADPPLLLVSTRGGSVETADFNGDGKLDLLFANGGNNAFLQLGNGNGTFQAPLPVASNTAVNTIVNCARTADLNNDHKADVLIDTVFLAGNGDGTFITPSGAFTFGGVFGCVPVIADFNKDGNLDVAFPQPASNNLSVQLGKGDGTFGPVTNFTLPNSALDVAAGDFNGDGILDLVATNGSSAVILLGKGDGTFQTPAQVPTAHSETQVTVGDVNGDGKLDLVFTDGFVITVMHGNGDGTFQPGVDYLAGTSPSKPQLADLNGDGEIDIAFANVDINTATTVTVLLNQSGKTVSLTSSMPTSQFGEPVVLSATVTPTVPDSPAPTGTITITSDGTTLGSGALAAGSFSVTPTTLPAGMHTIAGNYSGDSVYKPKALPSLVQTVTRATTTSKLSTTANPNIFGQPLKMTAKVVPAFSGIPTGSVTFSEGATVLGSLLLDSNGSATIDLSSLSAGMHQIVASYAGDANFQASVSTMLAQQVFFPTTIALNGSSSRQLVTSQFTANIKVSSPNGTPSGKVNLMEGSVILAQLTLDQTGSASFSSTTFTDGSHSLSAVYVGDGFFSPGTSPTLTDDVFDFSVSATPTAATISRGQSASFTLTVTPIDGFNGSVAFACQGLPAFASCTFNPTSLTPNGGPVSGTLTVTTTAAALTFPWSGPGLLECLWLAGLLSGLIAARELARRSIQQGRLPALRLSLLTLAIGGCMLMVSCGGGSSTPPPPPPITTNITVSSTATSGAASDSHSLAVTITVN